MCIITKSELRQNYCITEDKLQHFTVTITVAPFQRLMGADKDKVTVMKRCLLMGKVTLFCLHKSKNVILYSFSIIFCLNVMSQSWI